MVHCAERLVDWCCLLDGLHYFISKIVAVHFDWLKLKSAGGIFQTLAITLHPTQNSLQMRAHAHASGHATSAHECVCTHTDTHRHTHTHTHTHKYTNTHILSLSHIRTHSRTQINLNVGSSYSFLFIQWICYYLSFTWFCLNSLCMHDFEIFCFHYFFCSLLLTSTTVLIQAVQAPNRKHVLTNTHAHAHTHTHTHSANLNVGSPRSLLFILWIGY